jgi:hypothetical protein
VSLLEVASGRLNAAPVWSPDGAPVNGFAVSAREDLLVAAASGGMVFLADPGTARLIGSAVQMGSTDLTSVALSPNQSLLAALDTDGSLHLWNRGIGRALGPPLRSDTPSYGPFFLPGGQRLITGSFAGLLSWDLDAASWQETACALAGRDLSREEWDAFLPDEPYRGTCSAD